LRDSHELRRPQCCGGLFCIRLWKQDAYTLSALLPKTQRTTIQYSKYMYFSENHAVMIRTILASSFCLYLTSGLQGQFASPIILDEDLITTRSVHAADLNNDGLTDLAYCRIGTQAEVGFYLNMGGNTYSERVLIEHDLTSPTSINAADFNQDGWIDLVAVSPHNDKLQIWLNQQGSFPNQSFEDQNINYPFLVRTADINHDGLPDMVVLTDVSVVYYENTGNATFSKQVLSPQTEFYDMFLSDIDQDGFSDIVLGGPTSAHIFRNESGQFSFDADASNSIENNGLIIMVHLADLDGDGDNDLVIGGQNHNNLSWYANDGTGSFSLAHVIDSQAKQVTEVSLADLDSDGDIDIVAVLPIDNIVVWYANDGTGMFGPRQPLFTDALPLRRHVTTADANDDGLIDIIVANPLTILLNNVVVSTTSFADKPMMCVFPNPTEGVIHIDTKIAGQLSIWDVHGTAIVQKSELSAGTHMLQLPQTAASGMYWLRLTTVHGTYTQKIVVVH